MMWQLFAIFTGCGRESYLSAKNGKNEVTGAFVVERYKAIVSIYRFFRE